MAQRAKNVQVNFKPLLVMLFRVNLDRFMPISRSVSLATARFLIKIVSSSRQVCVYCKIEEERRRQKNVTEKRLVSLFIRAR
jgi:hypothetical protein